MKTKNFISILIILLISFDTYCQSKDSVMLKPIGIGLHIEQFKIADLLNEQLAPVNKLVLVLNSNNNFRIEPELGFRTGKSNDVNNSVLAFGIGVFGMNQRNKLNLYYGGRFEYAKVSISETEMYSSDITTLMIGPAFGAEYFLSEIFSLGGEMSLLYTHLSSGTNYYWSTNTGLFFRFYF